MPVKNTSSKSGGSKKSDNIHQTGINSSYAYGIRAEKQAVSDLK